MHMGSSGLDKGLFSGVHPLLAANRYIIVHVGWFTLAEPYVTEPILLPLAIGNIQLLGLSFRL